MPQQQPQQQQQQQAHTTNIGNSAAAARDGADLAVDNMRGNINYTQDAATRAKDAARELQHNAQDAGRELRHDTHDAVQHTQQAAHDIVDSASQAGRNITNRASESVDAAQRNAAQAYNSARDTLQSAKSSAQQTAQNMAETARQTARPIVDGAKQAVDGAKTTAQHAVENVQHSARSFDITRTRLFRALTTATSAVLYAGWRAYHAVPMMPQMGSSVAQGVNATGVTSLGRSVSNWFVRMTQRLPLFGARTVQIGRVAADDVRNNLDAQKRRSTQSLRSRSDATGNYAASGSSNISGRHGNNANANAPRYF